MRLTPFIKTSSLLWFMLVTLLSIVAVPKSVSAQADISPDSTVEGNVVGKRSFKITISGEFSFSLVGRNDELFEAALGDAVTGNPGAPLVPSSATGSGGEVFFDPMITLNMEFELANRLSAFVQLETQFFELRNRAGGVLGVDRDLEVEQAYIRWENAFNQDNLDFQFGIQDFRKDFTQNGNPFLVDVAHSESPFNNPAVRPADFGTPQSSSSGSPGIQEAAGAYAAYNWGESMVDFWYFTLSETFRKNSDDVMFGASLEHDYGDSGHAGLILMVLQNSGSTYLWTLGGGGYGSLADGAVKVYGEFYAQAGDYARQLGRRVKQQEAFAGYAGLRFFLPGNEDSEPFIDVSYWEVTGDDNGDDFVNEAFVSLENNNDTIVVEDGYYGLDIDSNYRAFKVKGGFTPANNITFEALYGLFFLQDNNGLADARPNSDPDRIGSEIDFRLNYRPADNVLFQLRTGWLVDGDALGFSRDINITVLEARITF